VLRRQLSQLNQQIYTISNGRSFDEVIDAYLLTEEAKRGGLSLATLLEREVHDKVARVSDDEVRRVLREP
jgi:hypothetical protein